MPSIPVAGADRLVLTEHIAVMDLMALADALLLPDDDLALASVLKSPLFGLSEEQLFELAWDRKRLAAREPARQALPISPRPSARSTNWRRPRAQLTPFGFFAHVLGAHAAARNSWRGSGRRRTTRSTNSSIWRSTTRRARRRRCKASSPGCAPRRAKCGATWKWRATKCG